MATESPLDLEQLKRLRRATERSALDAGDPERALVDAALAGDDAGVQAALERWPDLPAHSTPCALVLAQPPPVSIHDVNAAMPPRGWPPLLYLCSSRYRTAVEDHGAARPKAAQTLIDLGANVNAGVREAHTIRGYCTALGAAIGLAQSPQLAQLLLRAGADVADGPTLYEGCAMWHAVCHRDVESVELLLAAEPPQWHVCHALPHALRHDDLAFTRLLLDNGGDPNWTMGTWGFKGNCLHEAVLLNNGPAIFEALLEHGAQVSFQDRDGRTPFALATCLHRDEAAALLRQHGAKDAEIRPVDRWIAACFGGDAAAARRLAIEHSGQAGAIGTLHDNKATKAQHDAARAQLAASFKGADHLWLSRVIARLGEDAPPVLRGADERLIQLLLAGGLDPDAADDDGERPLHLAAAAGDAFALNALLAAGADPGTLNFAGQTPLDVALASGHHSLAEQLAKYGGSATTLPDPDFDRAFERTADAVVEGDIELLRNELGKRPALATARSSRPHRCTLLNYLGANGFEGWRQKTPANAVEIIEVLIESGSDPNAVCYTYRGGPGEHTLGLLTSSGHPREAGLTLAMVAALGRGGATLDAVYTLLTELFDARQEARLADAVGSVDVHSEIADRTMLESAMLGETDILFALLDAGANINAQRGDGAAALHLAAFDGNGALVDALLARGADPSLRDHVFDGTAVGWAFAGGHEDLGKAMAARL